MRILDIDKEVQERYDLDCYLTSIGVEDDFYKKQLEVKKQEREFAKEVKEEDPEWARDRRMAYLEPVIKELFQEVWDMGCYLEEKKGERKDVYAFAEYLNRDYFRSINKKYKKFFIEYGILKGGFVFSKKGIITNEDVEQARNVPIENFLEFNRMGLCECIWHEEKHGSLKLYRSNNKVHCFGACARTYDVIDVVKKLYSLDFISAVRFLLE